MKNTENTSLTPESKRRVRAVLEGERRSKIDQQIHNTREKVGGILGWFRRFFQWRPILGEGGVRDLPIYPEEKISLGVSRAITNPIRKVLQAVGKVLFGIAGFAYGSAKSGAKEAAEFSAKLGDLDSTDTPGRRSS